jgi:peroxiredoxin
MKAIEATQFAQAAEMAELRGASEVALRLWYESGVLKRSSFVADMESRVSQVERQVRRREHEKENEKEI